MNIRSTEEIKALYRITDKELNNVIKFGKIAIPKLPKLLEKWYGWLSTTPEFEEFFHDETTQQHAQKMQLKYWETFFEGEVNDEYIAYRKKIGEIHARIGLPQDIYLAGVEHFSQMLLDLLDASKTPVKSAGDIRRALLKLVHLDMTTIVQSYEEMVNAKIASQSKSLLEMSTPVTQLWSGLLLLPVVGLIDSRRAQDIMNNTLVKISETHAKSFILDISGVAVVDTAVANHLIKITKATKLMGCDCIISGVSPAIAQTIVELGINVETMKTTSDMKAALEAAFDHLGMTITES